MELLPQRIKIIESRLSDGHYLQRWVEAVSDLMFVIKLYHVEREKAEKYWNAANEAELKLEEIQHIIDNKVREVPDG